MPAGSLPHDVEIELPPAAVRRRKEGGAPLGAGLRRRAASPGEIRTDTCRQVVAGEKHCSARTRDAQEAAQRFVRARQPAIPVDHATSHAAALPPRLGWPRAALPPIAIGEPDLGWASLHGDVSLTVEVRVRVSQSELPARRAQRRSPLTNGPHLRPHDVLEQGVVRRVEEDQVALQSLPPRAR